MELRRLPFLLALAALALAFAVELGLGGSVVKGAAAEGASIAEAFVEAPPGLTSASSSEVAAFRAGNRDALDRPGKGIPSLALLDGVLLLMVGLLALPLVVPENVQVRFQGLATLVVSILVLIGAVVVAFAAIELVTVMVGLLLATPFGTIAYLAIWGSFSVGAAEATLGALLALKLAFAVLLVLAQQRFLENKGLVLLVLTSLVLNVVVSFLIGFPPSILAAITDVIGAIVNAVVAAVWAVLLLVFSIVSIIRILLLTRGSAAVTAG